MPRPHSWYYSPYSWGYGFALYDPWFYGSYWSAYPFGYLPYGYGGYSSPYLGGGYQSTRDRVEENNTGAIRLRANLREAKVYIDGALVGIVDDFDGLTGHLDIEAGPHQLELRAPGYQTYSTDIVVPRGKTTTERATMKKQ